MQSMRCKCSFFSAIVLLTALLWASAAIALQPPAPGEIESLKKNGWLRERIENARVFGNHLIDPYLLERALTKAKNKALLQSGVITTQSVLPAPPPAWQGMPTSGNVKIFALLIDFSDYPAYNSAANINSAIFGDGSLLPNSSPYESLTRYYSRSSYNQLNLAGGMTLGWYRPAYTRASMPQTDAAREQLITAAISSFNGSVDFSQFDNNGDGTIDYFAVIWTGPDNGWSGFWWGYQTNFYLTPNFSVDGKKLGKYSWQWEYNVGADYRGPFSPAALIHETGHALGLPDYYDYDQDIGPDGGVGWLDMMDGGKGDHNSFSKWVLGWVAPAVVANGSQSQTLDPSGITASAVLVMPGASAEEPFREFFIAQNRYRVGNDANAGYPADGMLIWHVDARLDASGQDYLYDNSYTSHKLLKLMEADGLERIEGFSATVDAAMYYQPGHTLAPDSSPSSRTYFGEDSRVRINEISRAGQLMTASFGIDAVSSLATLNVSKPDYGMVTSSPAGISCGDDCVESVSPGTSISLSAQTTAGVAFAGWSGGGCEGIGDCQVSMSSDQTITANFSTTLLLDQPFSGGTLPSGWTIASADQGNWWFNNESDNYTGGAGRYAVGTRYSGFAPPIDIGLRTPALDASPYTTVGLQFKTDVWDLQNGTADVDVSINGGSAWTNVWRSTDSLYGPAMVDVDLSDLVGGESNVMLRFRFDGDYVWWSLDDVKVFAATEQTLTPLNDDTEFVKQVYRDFLNREADAEGLDFWADQLASGTLTREELVEQYLLCPEFGERIAPVVRLYFTYFLRLPDYDGLMFWVNAFGAGMTLDQISDEFVQSPEFIDRYGTLSNAQFVSQMYQNVYEREPDPDGLAFWTGHLDAGNMTRGEVMVAFATAPEYLALSANRVYVTMTYIGLLRRVPDDDGFDYWVGVIDLGASGLALIDSFLESGEYAARFAP